MSAVAVTHITPSHIVVQIGSRQVTVGGEAVVGRPGAPYFVFSDTIRAWQPPHEHELLTGRDRELALEAIRAYMQSRAMSLVIDPTDEQYRTL
ncbi:MAG: Imm74 family immunity protein [Polyangiaceae bacterium]